MSVNGDAARTSSGNTYVEPPKTTSARQPKQSLTGLPALPGQSLTGLPALPGQSLTGLPAFARGNDLPPLSFSQESKAADMKFAVPPSSLEDSSSLENSARSQRASNFGLSFAQVKQEQMPFETPRLEPPKNLLDNVVRDESPIASVLSKRPLIPEHDEVDRILPVEQPLDESPSEATRQAIGILPDEDTRPYDSANVARLPASGREESSTHPMVMMSKLKLALTEKYHQGEACQETAYTPDGTRIDKWESDNGDTLTVAYGTNGEMRTEEKDKYRRPLTVIEESWGCQGELTFTQTCYSYESEKSFFAEREERLSLAGKDASLTTSTTSDGLHRVSETSEWSV